MKKLLFLSLFSLIGFYGTAQVTVVNSTLYPLLVGVQFSSGPGSCDPVYSDTWTIPPGNNHAFIPTPGMELIRVGVSGTPGSQFEGAPCNCPTMPSAPYVYDWSADCSVVNIFY